ncbi:hypothetical protein LCGC14_2272520 [marine sediment metagenome]|uniref:Uncharacterized protein n=1 Tax=marine sediment metagenome TaxID=412755 RepID=A0A0F9CWQ5_9ZZZZ
MKSDRRIPGLKRYGIIVDALQKLADAGDVDAADRLADLSSGRNITATDTAFVQSKITTH